MKAPMNASRYLSIALLCCTLPFQVLAEKADRDQPVNLEADRITVDDANKLHILEGKVKLIQGTLIIHCEKLVVRQDAAGFQQGTATGGAGGLARFRQKREGKDEYIDGEAERIVHDARNDKTEFFQRAMVRSGADEVHGQYISYDGHTENYLVTGGTAGDKSPGQRVHAVIQPKSRPAATPATIAPTVPGPGTSAPAAAEHPPATKE